MQLPLVYSRLTPTHLPLQGNSLPSGFYASLRGSWSYYSLLLMFRIHLISLLTDCSNDIIDFTGERVVRGEGAVKSRWPGVLRPGWLRLVVQLTGGRVGPSPPTPPARPGPGHGSPSAAHRVWDWPGSQEEKEPKPKLGGWEKDGDVPVTLRGASRREFSLKSITSWDGIVASSSGEALRGASSWLPAFLGWARWHKTQGGEVTPQFPCGGTEGLKTYRRLWFRNLLTRRFEMQSISCILCSQARP